MEDDSQTLRGTVNGREPMAATTRRARRRQAARADRRQRIGSRPLWLLIPAFGLLTLIIVVPMALDLYLSFLNVNLTTLHRWLTAPWAGLSNYLTALTSGNAIEVSAARAMWLSVKFSVLTTLITTPIGFMVAVSVNHRFKGRATLRSVFLIPYVIPTVVTAFVARLMFLNDTGLVDTVLSRLGLTDGNTFWLLGPKTFWVMLGTESWAAWPFIYVMILAALAAVPSDLYEAAEMDGAGYFAKLRYIVLPSTKNVLLLAMLLSTIFHLGQFTIPYVMFGTPPPVEVQVLPISIYTRAFTTFEYSLAAATSVLMLLVLMIPGAVYLRMTRLAAADQGEGR